MYALKSMSRWGGVWLWRGCTQEDEGLRKIHGHGHRLSLGPQGFGPVNSTAAYRAIWLLMQPPFQVPKLPIVNHTMADTDFFQGRR